MEALQWTACLILGVPSALLIPLNWHSFVGWLIAVRRGHKDGHSFAPPFLCGIAGAVTGQLDEKLTEPNSALGSAIRYMLRHWEKLTLFLRQAGAPLDNNVCERALKKAITVESNLFRRQPCPKT